MPQDGWIALSSIPRLFRLPAILRRNAVSTAITSPPTICHANLLVVFLLVKI